MLLAVHARDPRTGYAHKYDVHLIVDVLPDAPSCVETHQVGVQVATPFERPDHPYQPPGGRGEFVQVWCFSCQRSLLLPIVSVGIRDLEAKHQ